MKRALPRSLAISLSTIITPDGLPIEGVPLFLRDKWQKMPLFASRMVILARPGSNTAGVETMVQKDRIIFCDTPQDEQAFCWKHGVTDIIHNEPNADGIFHFAEHIFILTQNPRLLLPDTLKPLRVHTVLSWLDILEHPVLSLN